jgi:hypothetical protein
MAIGSTEKSISNGSSPKPNRDGRGSRALEADFPFEKLHLLAELESWRKEVNRPIYHVHKWWANRLGSVFRALILAGNLDPDEDVWAEFYKSHVIVQGVARSNDRRWHTLPSSRTRLSCVNWPARRSQIQFALPVSPGPGILVVLLP